MKIILFAAFLLVSQITTHAQFKTIAESRYLSDDNLYSGDVLLMENGNTVYIGLSPKEVRVKIYNQDHKEIVDSLLHPDLGKPSSYRIRGLFEVNGDIAVFISDVDKHQMVLHRLIIDGKTAALKLEGKIEDLKKYSYAKGFGLIFGVTIPDFYVERMPGGDGYVVALMNSFESDRNKRISVAVYNAEHQEINRAYYNSPDDKFKYMKYIGMAIPDKERICVMAYGYNTRASGGKECELVMATMNKKDPSMELHEMTATLRPAKAEVLKYNPVTKKLVLLQAFGRKDEVDCFLTMIDPFTAAVTFTKGIHSDSTKKNCDSPQDLAINKDGTVAVIYEDIENIEAQRKYGMYLAARIRNITVTQFDTAGTLTSSWVIVKDQLIEEFRKLVLQNREYDLRYPQYFFYLSTADNNFILLNNDAESVEDAKNGKEPKKVKSMAASDGFYYTSKGSKWLFEEPVKKNYTYGNFFSSDYDATRNVYVTLKLERKAREELKVRLVWMQP